VHSSISLAPEPRSASEARHFVEESLRNRVPADTTEVAVLLTSELVTNVIVHARTRLRLDVDHEDSEVCVAVADDVPQVPVQRGGRGTKMTGRGMALVAMLAATWGVDATPPGKTVWFCLSA
jgi:anti-sigma regulatory factor (Ser/Thr protein kinase)